MSFQMTSPRPAMFIRSFGCSSTRMTSSSPGPLIVAESTPFAHAELPEQTMVTVSSAVMATRSLMPGRQPVAPTGCPASEDRAVVPFPVGLSELELLELARRRPGQLGPHLHGRGALEVGEVSAAVLDEIRLGDALPRGWHHERL